MDLLNTARRRTGAILLMAGLAMCAAFCTNLDGVTAPSCAFSLSSASASFDNRGGTGTVAVHTPSSCTWSVTANDPWVSFTTATSGTGDASIGYSVAANSASGNRSATLNVSGQSFTVSQAGTPGAVCTYAAAPNQASFSSTGGTGTVTVTAGSGCAWTATTQAGWISITAGKSGTSDGAVKYAVAPNNTKHDRSDILIVAGKTVTISQAASK